MANQTSKKDDDLQKMKNNVEMAYQNFRPNYTRFNEFRKFFFKTSLSDDDVSLLIQLDKPQLEVNLGEAFVSRLMGEFSKQEPSIEVRASHDHAPDTAIVGIVDGYMRHLLADSNKKNFEYRVMDDLYSGGWSVMKLTAEYIHEESFDYDFNLDRVYEPTLCGFDPMARNPAKEDGEFCFENIPMTAERFKSLHPDIDIERVEFIGDADGFSWSYKSEDQTKVVLVCDYYKKKRNKYKIVQIPDPMQEGKTQTMRKDDYDKMVKEWVASGRTEVPPVIIKERETEETTISRVRFIEDQIIEEEEMDFKDFPLIYVDGNSKLIRESEGGAYEWLTRPYLYHCKDIQRLMNFAVQTLANYLENMVMHKFIIAKEAIPQEEDYLQPYSQIQQPNQIVYNGYKDDNPDMPLPAPVPIQIPAAPAEMMGTIKLCIELMQHILGSYDASIGINNNQLSGIAIQEAATQSNAAAMPYIVGFLTGLSHVANMVTYLIPRYLITPRSLPMRTIEGKTSYVEVNTPGNPSLKYKDNSLHVIVKAGVNWAVQQDKAFQMIVNLMKTSKIFDQFMNTKGLPTLLENVDFRGIDKLRMQVGEWVKMLEKQQAEQANQPNPEMMKIQVEMQKLQAKMKEVDDKMKINDRKMEVEEEKLELEKTKVLADISKQEDENYRADKKVEAEKIIHATDHAVKRMDQTHAHRMDHMKHGLEVSKHEHEKSKPKEKKTTTKKK